MLRDRVLSLLGLTFILCLVGGCGPSKGVKVSGHLLRNGSPFKPHEKHTANVRLSPEDATASLPACIGQVDAATGAFTLQGPNAGQGVAPGKYKVVVTVDAYPGSPPSPLGDAFSEAKTTLKYEVTTDANQEIKVDIGAKTVTK